jgi:DNA-binding MarR family transcriptional regulator
MAKEEELPAEMAQVDVAGIASFRQQHIGRLLLNAQRNYSLEALAKLRARGYEGLNLAHTNLLPHLDVGGTRLTTLAERLGVTKQAIGTVVGELEAKGYVRREEDAHDRRAVVITFTAAGWTFLQDAHEVKREIEAEYIATLGEQGFAELCSLLTQLTRAT